MDIPAEDLIKLDGICSEETQKLVNQAKQVFRLKGEMLTEAEAKLISDVLDEATTKGIIVLRYEGITYCRVCEKKAGYATWKRNTRYHSKGEPNYNKPLTLSGVEMRKSYVTIKGHVSVGCCSDCFNKLKPYIIDALDGVKAQIPEALGGGKYKRYDNMECTECGWKGNESEMGKLKTLMGDGTYHGQCPTCDAKNVFLVTKIKKAEGFSLVAVPNETP